MTASEALTAFRAHEAEILEFAKTLPVPSIFSLTKPTVLFHWEWEGGKVPLRAVIDMDRRVAVAVVWEENGKQMETPIPRLDVVWTKPREDERIEDSAGVPAGDRGSPGRCEKCGHPEAVQ